MKFSLVSARALILGLSASAMALSSSPAAATQYAVQFNLTDTGGVAVGSQAYIGFKAAADYWSSILTTSQAVTINLNVGYSALGPGILGSTGSTFTSRAVQSVEARIAARQFGAFDAQAVAGLPTLTPGTLGVGALSMNTPGYTGVDLDGNPYGIDNSTTVYDTDGGFNNSVIGLTTANAKALGYTFGSGPDARITFSSAFNFDFTPQNGITTNYYDFVGVAIHEMGHALGFVSGVDDYDFLGTGGPAADADCGGFLCKDYAANDDWFGETLDLFRYSAPGTLDWTTNTPSYFSIDKGVSAYGSGYFSTGSFNGDGWQASHWKAPGVCTGLLGVMNPYLCRSRNAAITGLDLAALDAIGWNINANLGDYSSYRLSTQGLAVPEPATWAMMIVGFGLVGTMARRRVAAA